MRQNLIGKVALSLVVCWIIGCGDDYERSAEVADKAADRQAQQNTEMARVTKEVAEGTRRMVEADAAARKDVIEVHHDLQAERAKLSDGHNALESERKVIAQERRTESVLVPAARAAGLALAVAAVVGLCCILLIGSRKCDATDAELNDLLLDDLCREQTRIFIDTPPGIVHLPIGASEKDA